MEVPCAGRLHRPTSRRFSLLACSLYSGENRFSKRIPGHFTVIAPPAVLVPPGDRSDSSENDGFARACAQRADRPGRKMPIRALPHAELWFLQRFGVAALPVSIDLDLLSERCASHAAPAGAGRRGTPPLQEYSGACWSTAFNQTDVAATTPSPKHRRSWNWAILDSNQ